MQPVVVWSVSVANIQQQFGRPIATILQIYRYRYIDWQLSFSRKFSVCFGITWTNGSRTRVPMLLYFVTRGYFWGLDYHILWHMAVVFCQVAIICHSLWHVAVIGTGYHLLWRVAVIWTGCQLWWHVAVVWGTGCQLWWTRCCLFILFVTTFCFWSLSLSLP
jgi:hypothetical protein